MIRKLYNLDPAGGGGPAAPAAPAAPAVSPLQAMIASKRDAIATGGSAGLFGAPAPQEAPPPQEQRPRNPDGTFARTAADVASDPATESQEPQEPQDLQEPQDGEPQENPNRVTLPGRHPNAPDVEIDVDDPEVADRLRQLRNGFLRGEEVRAAQAQLDSERLQLDEIATRLQVDPEGFLFDNIPAERAASVALQILAQPGVWDRVSGIVESMQEDDNREVIRTRLENERLRNRERASQEYEQRVAEQQTFRETKQAIAVLIPEHLPESQQVMLYQSCQQDVRDYMERTGVRTIDPRDVPLLLAARLREAGVDPLTMAASLRASSNGTPLQGSSSAPRARAAKVTTPTVQAVQNAANARRAMAMGSPTGTAPSAAGVNRPPKGQSITERLAWARQNLRFGGSTT